MVQNLSRPRLVTDSMSGGGVVHQSFGQSAPGSMPIDGPPAQGQGFEPLDQVMTGPGSPGPDRRLVSQGGVMDGAQDAPRPQGGGWHSFGDDGQDMAGWRQT